MQKTVLLIIRLLGITCLGGAILGGWLVLRFVEDEELQRAQTTIQTMLETTHSALEQWSATHITRVEQLAHSKEFKDAVERLLTDNHDGTTSHQTQQTLNRYVAPLLTSYHYRGYYVINREHINIASSRSEMIGQRTLLLSQPDYFSLWREQRHISLPMKTMAKVEQGTHLSHQVSNAIYVTAAVQDDVGNLQALLVIHLDPAVSLYPILQKAQIGDSGETYLVTQEGAMTSPTRFPVSFDVDDVDGMTQSSPSSELALESKQDTHFNEFADYRGVKVVGQRRWSSALGQMIVTKMDRSEMMRISHVLRFAMATLLISFAILSLIVLRGSFLYRKSMVNFQRRTRALIDNLPALFILRDDNLCVVDMNTSMRDFIEQLGMLPTPWRNQPDTDVLPRSLYELIYVENELIDGRFVPRTEEVSFDCDAHRMYFILCHFPISQMGNEVIAIGTLLTDITEQVEHNHLIEEQRQRLHTILETAAEGILSINDSGDILSANAYAADLFDLSSHQMRRKNMLELLSQTEHDTWLGLLKNPHSTSRRVELQARSGHGRLFPVGVAISSIRGSDDEVRICVVHDLTQLRNVETEMHMLNLQLQQKVNQVELDVRRIQDQHRQFIRHIQKELELVLQQDEQTPEGKSEPAPLIARLVQSIHDDIKCLQQVATHQPLSLATLSLPQFLEDVVSAVRSRRQTASVSLILDDDIPAKLIGDHDALKFVLVNLMLELIKSNEQKAGKIEVQMSELSDSCVSLLFNLSVNSKKQTESKRIVFSVSSSMPSASWPVQCCIRLIEQMKGQWQHQFAGAKGASYSLQLSLEIDKAPLN